MPKLIRRVIAGLAAAVAELERGVQQGLAGPRQGRMIPIRVEATAPRKVAPRR
jgi:hypothetical protein